MDTLTNHKDDSVIQLNPRFARVPRAVEYSGLSRTMIFALIKSGDIKSVSLKSKGKSRGIRMVDLKSIDDFLARDQAA